MNTLIILLIFFILIIFVAGIILLIFFLPKPQNQQNNRENISKLGDVCSNIKTCNNKLICNNNLCVYDVGYNCSKDTDCSTNYCNNLICKTKPVLPTTSSSKLVFNSISKPINKPISKPISNSISKPIIKLVSKQLFKNSIPPKYSNNSEDDEINSCGDDDYPINFLINSGSSDSFDQENNDIEIVTPCNIHNGIMYCNNTLQKVVDVTTYSNYILYLINDGSIICKNTETGEKKNIQSDLIVEKIVSFGGYIYSLFDGTLYYSTSLNNLKWKKSSILINDINHISVTLDETHLWVQNYEQGWLYFTNFNLILEEQIKGVRIYGNSIYDYIEICNGIGKVYIGGEIVEEKKNVYSAVMDNNGKVLWLKYDDEYLGVVLVGWNPCYLK